MLEHAGNLKYWLNRQRNMRVASKSEASLVHVVSSRPTRSAYQDLLNTLWTYQNLTSNTSALPPNTKHNKTLLLNLKLILYLLFKF